MADGSLLDRMVSQFRSTCRYYTGYPKDRGPSRIIPFTSERQFVQLLHEETETPPEKAAQRRRLMRRGHSGPGGHDPGTGADYASLRPPTKSMPELLVCRVNASQCSRLHQRQRRQRSSVDLSSLHRALPTRRSRHRYSILRCRPGPRHTAPPPSAAASGETLPPPPPRSTRLPSPEALSQVPDMPDPQPGGHRRTYMGITRQPQFQTFKYATSPTAPAALKSVLMILVWSNYFAPEHNPSPYEATKRDATARRLVPERRSDNFKTLAKEWTPVRTRYWWRGSRHSSRNNQAALQCDAHSHRLAKLPDSASLQAYKG